jgi:hypothetical protein
VHRAGQSSAQLLERRARLRGGLVEGGGHHSFSWSVPAIGVDGEKTVRPGP